MAPDIPLGQFRQNKISVAQTVIMGWPIQKALLADMIPSGPVYVEQFDYGPSAYKILADSKSFLG
jgi:hypothetical protein